MLGNLLKKFAIGAFSFGMLCVNLPAIFAEGDNKPEEVKHPTELSRGSNKIEHDSHAFRPDPTRYKAGDKYEPIKQLDIYGSKYAVETPRPLIELGRKLYDSGPIPEAFDFFGAKNPYIEHFMIFGDFKTAIAYVDGQNNIENLEQGVLAFQLNLELDLAITATERFHALIQPLDRGGKFTRWDFAGTKNDFDTNIDFFNDMEFNTFFFEGDLGAILTGALDRDMGFDLPFAIGLLPLLFHNGIWVEDAFTGFAVTIPALNSPALDISNMDITFFAGFDEVNTNALAGNDQDAKIFAVNMFIESNGGYWEIGYGFTYDDSDAGDADYHNLMVSFTRRYGGIISNSLRVIYNFGQKKDNIEGDGLNNDTADGVLLLVENSLISPLPLTLVPYLNMFAGFNKPQSLARGGANGGVLKNTGINFEKDNLTLTTTLDDTAQDTYGAALGIEYLCDPFGLSDDRLGINGQIVVEFAFVRELEGGESKIANEGSQYAFGLRFQQALSQATIIRVDANYIIQEDEEELSSIRFELRRKF